MRVYCSVFIFIACITASPLLAGAQSPKAGLYDVTSKMTWQHSPFPEGMQAPSGSGGPHTNQVCITQAQIDKYNGPKPAAHGGNCQVGDIQKNQHGVRAVITCGAPMTGKGTVQTTWTDSRHSQSKVHFNGSMKIGQDTKTVEWTLESESTFKSPDCGSVKPTDD